jgi:hypothetical protein
VLVVVLVLVLVVLVGRVMQCQPNGSVRVMVLLAGAFHSLPTMAGLGLAVQRHGQRRRRHLHGSSSSRVHNSSRVHSSSSSSRWCCSRRGQHQHSG